MALFLIFSQRFINMHDYYSGIHLSYSPDFQALFVARFGRFG